MRKIKVENKTSDKGNKKYTLITCIVIGAVLILAMILILVEKLSGGNVRIENNTDKNIESINVYFEDEEQAATGDIFNGKVNSGEKAEAEFNEISIAGGESQILFGVKFEGEETLYIYDGYFNGIYRGNVDIEFYQEDGEYYMYAKAGYGLFNSTELTDVNTKFFLDFENDDWDYR